MEFYTLKFDGSCGPKNPGGTAAYGYVLYHNGHEIARGAEVIGSGPTMSNNLAEYYALAEGLEAFKAKWDEQPNTFLKISGDSQLVVKQLNRKWGTDETKLYYPQYERADKLMRQLRAKRVRIQIEWIPRAQNQVCDDLSKAYKIHSKNKL